MCSNFLILTFTDIDCGKLPPLLYGSIHYLNNTTHLGSQVTYNCTRNYKLIGTPVRKCLPTRLWSGVSAKCEGKFIHFSIFSSPRVT